MKFRTFGASIGANFLSKSDNFDLIQYPTELIVMVECDKRNVQLGDLESLVCSMPQPMKLSTGKFAFVERAITGEHDHHYVIYLPKTSSPPSE